MTRTKGLLAVALLVVAAGAFTPGNAAAASRQNGTFQCTSAWSAVSNVPSGYIIGNCSAGTHLHRTWKSDLADGNYYDGGFVYGDVQGCGWINTNEDQMLNGDAWTACADTASRPLSDFANVTN